jgi:hypothetical protein
MKNGGLLAAGAVLVLGPALALVVLCARSPAPAAPASGATGGVHVVSAEQHQDSPPWCFVHWCFCPGLNAYLSVFPWSVDLGLEVCPAPWPPPAHTSAPSPTATSAPPSSPASPAPPAPSPSPTAGPTAASPRPTNPAPGGAASFPATVTLTSPPPRQTTSAPPQPASTPASPAAPPAVATVPASHPGPPQPNPAPPGAPTGYPRTQSNLLLHPATPVRAGLSVRLLLILVLVPCAAAGVLRYGGKR